MKIRWTAAPVLTAAMITAALGSLSSETALASSGPAGTGQPIASLNAVTADGTLAVGADSISTFLTPLCGEDLAELRGSKGWTALRTPSPPVCGWLDSVTALPHKRAWAVGYQLTKTAAVRTLTEYYNGSRWTIEPSP
ncbi:MAG TPA: hypothetical protein VMA95_17320, partial [Streptosporangiaceae bacterium]|nr:hypothetical protein [Streptosporangiaceae bacterium]